MLKIKCKQCSHQWFPRTEEPLECPACKSRRWKKENKKIG